MTLFLLTFSAIKAQIIMNSDNANNYSTFTNGSNFGTGFTPWDLTTNTSGGGTAGHIIASSSGQGFGNIDVSSKSFGMYGNPSPNNPSANAKRFLNNTGSALNSGRAHLLPGQTFKMEIAIAFRNGYKGFNLRDDNDAFLFNFSVENNEYRQNGTNLGWAYSQTSIFTVEVQQTDNNVYNVKITRGVNVYNSGDRTGRFSGIEMYIGNTDAGDDLNNLFFNNLELQRCTLTTTWDGVSWDNGLPDRNKNIAFTGDYSSTGNIEACSISVSNGADVVFNDSHTLTVDKEVSVTGVGSNLIFENNASLVQLDPSIVNTSAITFKRNSTGMKLYDYTYWGSPVSGQVLSSFSTATDTDNFFVYNAVPATNNWVATLATNSFSPGLGYAIQAPTTFTNIAQSFNGIFNGNPNNGNISQPVVVFDPGILNYNLLSNPYPSAIDVVSLIDNSNLGALYFWTHNTAASANVFTTDDYALRTRTTGTAAISGGSAPGQYITSGQGFFASSSVTGTHTFTNAMRVSDLNSKFYRNSNVQNNPANYYFHLNLTNTQGAFKQIALGYQDQATNGYDFGVDALASTQGVVGFYSIINPMTAGFGIQGRSYPWNASDQIDLGFSSQQSGSFTIAIDRFDSFFADKDIFLEDTFTATFHNLKTAPYIFSTTNGTFANRFNIHYQNQTLSHDSFEKNNQFLNVFKTNSTIEIISPSEKIKTVTVFSFTRSNVIF